MCEVSYLKNYWTLKCRKANITRVNKIYNEKLSAWSYKINFYQETNMRIDEIANNAKYRKDEQLQNLTIFWESS